MLDFCHQAPLVDKTNASPFNCMEFKLLKIYWFILE